MGEYPFLQVPLLSGGIVVAIMCLVHVLFAHYAVGAGFVLYGLEAADPNGDRPGLQRAQQLTAWTIVHVNLVLGALTGVGIWFTISLFSAEATEHLIQKFVWLWATEWTFFVIEIAIAYFYWYQRDRLNPGLRRDLARMYMLVSWATLLTITGILSYMLTSCPAGTLPAWFNATFLPSVLMRTGASIALACLVILTLVNLPPLFSFAPDSEEKKEVFHALYPYLASFFLVVPGAAWFRFATPPEAMIYAEGGSVPISMFLAGAGFLSALVGAAALFGFLYRRVYPLEMTLLLLVLWAAATSASEFVREGIRKPYIIRPMLYSNGLRPVDIDWWRTEAARLGTVLLVKSNRKFDQAANQPGNHDLGGWQIPSTLRDPTKLTALEPVDRGRYIFRSQCSACHTFEGFNALRHLTGGWQGENFTREFLRVMHVQKTFMPPFLGTDRDIEDLRRYVLAELASDRPVVK